LNASAQGCGKRERAQGRGEGGGREVKRRRIQKEWRGSNKKNLSERDLLVEGKLLERVSNKGPWKEFGKKGWR